MTMKFADDVLHRVERIRSEVRITNAGHPRHVVRRRGRADTRSKAPEFLGEASSRGAARKHRRPQARTARTDWNYRLGRSAYAGQRRAPNLATAIRER
jgi:hypothetical protein